MLLTGFVILVFVTVVASPFDAAADDSGSRVIALLVASGFCGMLGFFALALITALRTLLHSPGRRTIYGVGVSLVALLMLLTSAIYAYFTFRS